MPNPHNGNGNTQFRSQCGYKQQIICKVFDKWEQNNREEHTKEKRKKKIKSTI